MKYGNDIDYRMLKVLCHRNQYRFHLELKTIYLYKDIAA